MSIPRSRTNKQLAQYRPSATAAIVIYSSPEAISYTNLKTIIICNAHTSAVTYQIFHDDDGEVLDLDSALFYNVSIAANSTEIISLPDPGITISGYSVGSLGVRASVVDVLTFTLYGQEVTI